MRSRLDGIIYHVHQTTFVGALFKPLVMRAIQLHQLAKVRPSFAPAAMPLAFPSSLSQASLH
jgi:hypothetical protein